MKAVMLSITPKYCELIASGKKTLEIRKTKPKLKAPYKCYIYCTQEKTIGELLLSNGKVVGRNKGFRKEGDIALSGTVIGDFVCEKVDEITASVEYYADYYDIDDDSLCETCLTRPKLHEYGKGKILYSWHISDLRIYDTPKKLYEFFVWKKCNSCRDTGYESTACCYDVDCKIPAAITRPPQSWCYAEDNKLQTAREDE